MVKPGRIVNEYTKTSGSELQPQRGIEELDDRPARVEVCRHVAERDAPAGNSLTGSPAGVTVPLSLIGSDISWLPRECRWSLFDLIGP